MNNYTITKSLRVWLGLLSGVALLAGSTQLALAQSNQQVVTQLRPSFAGTVNLNGEPVDFSGEAHLVVVVEFRPGRQKPGKIKIVLDKVVGIGQSTGQVYRAVGARQEDFLLVPEEGLSFSEVYNIVPPTPLTPPNAVLPLHFFIQFDSSGNAVDANVSVVAGEP